MTHGRGYLPRPCVLSTAGPSSCQRGPSLCPLTHGKIHSRELRHPARSVPFARLRPARPAVGAVVPANAADLEQLSDLARVAVAAGMPASTLRAYRSDVGPVHRLVPRRPGRGGLPTIGAVLTEYATHAAYELGWTPSAIERSRVGDPHMAQTRRAARAGHGRPHGGPQGLPGAPGQGQGPEGAAAEGDPGHPRLPPRDARHARPGHPGRRQVRRACSSSGSLSPGGAGR